MKYSIQISKVLCFFSISYHCLAEEILLNRISAVVDSEPVLLSEIQRKLAHGPLVKFSSYPLKEGKGDPYNQALNDSINGVLVKRRAEQLDIEVTKEEIEKRIDQSLSEQGRSRAGMMAFLEQKNIRYEDYSRDIGDHMLYMRFKGREIIPKIRISDKDLEEHHLKSQSNIPLSSQEMTFERIDLAPKITENDAFAYYDKLRSGVNPKQGQALFGNQTESNTSFTMKASDLSKDFLDPLSKIEVGEYTKPILLSGRYIILHLSSRRYLDTKNFLAKKDELEARLRSERIIEQTALWFRTERAKSKIRIIPE